MGTAECRSFGPEDNVHQSPTEVSRPRLLPFGPPGLIARSLKAPRASALHKSCTSVWRKSTGFYEVCEATLEQGTPGV